MLADCLNLIICKTKTNRSTRDFLPIVFSRAFTAFQMESQSFLFFPFCFVCVFLEAYFVIDKLSTKLEQSYTFYHNRLMTMNWPGISVERFHA